MKKIFKILQHDSHLSFASDFVSLDALLIASDILVNYLENYTIPPDEE